MPLPLVEPSEREAIRVIKRRIQGLPEVADCKEVTMGFTRKKPNIHMHAMLKGNPTYQETHRTCSRIESEVRRLVPNARVVIHSEPWGVEEGERVWKIVKKVAEAEPGSRGVQNIHLKRLEGKLGVDFHLQIGSLLSGQEAADLETRLEKKLKEADPRISEVVIHHTTLSQLVSNEQTGEGTEVRWYVEHVAKSFPEVKQVRPPMIRKFGDQLEVALRVTLIPSTGTEKATEIASRLGTAIKKGYPAIARAEVVEERGDLGKA